MSNLYASLVEKLEEKKVEWKVSICHSVLSLLRGKTGRNGGNEVTGNSIANSHCESHVTAVLSHGLAKTKALPWMVFKSGSFQITEQTSNRCKNSDFVKSVNTFKFVKIFEILVNRILHIALETTHSIKGSFRTTEPQSCRVLQHILPI